MLNKLLKKYDSYLGCRKHLDGSITIFRQSPFTTIKFDILNIENQYLGSCKWVLRKIVMMDSRRKDFIIKSIQNNNNLRKQKKDDRQSREVADYLLNSGMTLIN